MKQLYFLLLCFCTLFLKGQNIISFKSAGTQDQYVPVVFQFINQPFSVSRPDVHQDRNWLGYGIATINGIGYGWGSGNTLIKLENFTTGTKNNDNTGGRISFIGKVLAEWASSSIIVYLRGGTTYTTTGVVKKNTGSYSASAGSQMDLQPASIDMSEYNIPPGIYVGTWEINSSTKSIESNISSISGISKANGNFGFDKINPLYKMDINGNFRSGSSDTFFSYNVADINLKHAPRGSGGRAVVHDADNILTINYDNDFTGGTKLGSSFLVKKNNAYLQGKLEAKEIKVTSSPTADFVFEESYELPKLEEVEKHIKEKKHLPEIASAKEMEANGVNIGEFQIKLLQKIEELTLYTIEQNKLNKEQAALLQSSV